MRYGRAPYRDMFRCNPRPTIFNDDHRSADTASIAGNMNGSVVMIDIDAHELADASRSSNFAKLCDKAGWISSEPNYSTVNVHHEGMGSVYFRTRGKTDVWNGRWNVRISSQYIRGTPLTFHAQHICQTDDWLLFHIGRNVSHESKILHQTAGLAFWRITGAQHTPLTGLQRSRTADLPRLLELR